ncbi:hypothetical protein LEP1GSC127_2595 [Leptospira kirschneri str. 200801925]|nr:hypothetical protein LEP1GSC127_2595 [Leptospira kirschneri str. 200801925]
MKNFRSSSNPKSIQIPIGNSQVLAAEIFGEFPISKNSAPPVICIHGLTGNLKKFHPSCKRFSKTRSYGNHV